MRIHPHCDTLNCIDCFNTKGQGAQGLHCCMLCCTTFPFHTQREAHGQGWVWHTSCTLGYVHISHISPCTARQMHIAPLNIIGGGREPSSLPNVKGQTQSSLLPDQEGHQGRPSTVTIVVSWASGTRTRAPVPSPPCERRTDIHFLCVERAV